MGETRKPRAGFTLSRLRTDRPIVSVDEEPLFRGQTKWHSPADGFYNHSSQYRVDEAQSLARMA